MKVFISAGHGGSDPGACGNGLKEKECNLYIALAFGSVLEAAGIQVRYSRTCDENDPVTSEVAEANAFQADYAISFHNNAGGGIGSECWIWPGCVEAERIAKAFENVTIDAGYKSRGVKTTTSLYFIRNTSMTAVLSETAFIDNKTDKCRIDTQAKCERIGSDYALAFLEVMGIYPMSSQNDYPNVPFLFKAKGNTCIFQSPDADTFISQITDKRRYTIIDVKGDYGFLKSGAGWIYLPDVEIVR